MRGIAVGLMLTVAAQVAGAATLVVAVRDSRGVGVPNAVVYAIPEGRKVAPPTRTAVLDQKDRMFVPHVLPVQTGTAVSFPNSDNVRHQVYSFSPAKRFQLPLYEGTPAVPIVFDKPGVVALGCNIHDRMSAFVIVVDTPHFGLAESGRVELTSLPDGKYVVHAWYEGMREEPPSQSVTLDPGGQRDLVFQIDRK